MGCRVLESDKREYVVLTLHDAAGRTTSVVRSSGTTTVAYDFESRITSVSKSGMTTNSYTYNGLDARVGAVDSGGTRAFRRAGVGATSAVLGDGFADYTPGGEVRGGVKKTSHGGMKNQDMQTNSPGSIAASKMFDAFGNVVSGSGSWSGPYGYGGDYGYQGDVDTGWRLLGHRYYDSDTGRFLTRDPAKDGRNWYSYCGNNPISGADPSGLKLKIIIAGYDDLTAEAMRFAIYEAIGLIWEFAIATNNVKLIAFLIDLLYGETEYTIQIVPGERIERDRDPRLDTNRIDFGGHNFSGTYPSEEGEQPGLLAQLLIHEFTHIALGTGDELDDGMETVKLWETDFMKFFGLPPRNRYQWTPTGRGLTGADIFPKTGPVILPVIRNDF